MITAPLYLVMLGETSHRSHRSTAGGVDVRSAALRRLWRRGRVIRLAPEDASEPPLPWRHKRSGTSGKHDAEEQEPNREERRNDEVAEYVRRLSHGALDLVGEHKQGEQPA